jgi:hypothetical protein
MSETVYYCVLNGKYTYEFPEGVVAIPFKREYTTKITRCISYSDKVWVQGPRGGVKIIKDRLTYPSGVYGYVTKNKELMKEFMWVKLKAQTLHFYT